MTRHVWSLLLSLSVSQFAYGAEPDFSQAPGTVVAQLLVTTDDPELAAAVRALRDHGQTRKLYDHDLVGTNSRMDEIQAAVLRAKLPHIEDWTADRRRIAARYDDALADLPVEIQRVAVDGESAYHLYTIRIPSRDDVRAALQADGIDSGVYYPLPLHRQGCFTEHDQIACPVADRLAAEVLSLPCFPSLTVAEQDRVIDSLRRALA